MKNENDVVDHRARIAALNGKLGMIKRWKPEDLDGLRAAQRAVTVAKIEQAIDKATAGGVSLTDEDVVQLTAVLRGLVREDDTL
jgi:hypothetical protein